MIFLLDRARRSAYVLVWWRSEWAIDYNLARCDFEDYFSKLSISEKRGDPSLVWGGDGGGGAANVEDLADVLGCWVSTLTTI